MLVNEQPDACQGESQILHPGSRALFRYWEGIRGEESAPRRDQIDLKQIRNLVPGLAIIERTSGISRYRWRLAGSEICEIFRHEVTGRPVLEGWNPFERDVIARLLDGAVDHRQPCILRFRLHSDHGQLIGTEMIGLPLRAADGSIHVFGGMFAFRDIHPISYTGIVAMELSGARAIWTEHLPGDQRINVQFREPATRPFRPFQVFAGGRR